MFFLGTNFSQDFSPHYFIATTMKQPKLEFKGISEWSRRPRSEMSSERGLPKRRERGEQRGCFVLLVFVVVSVVFNLQWLQFLPGKAPESRSVLTGHKPRVAVSL